MADEKKAIILDISINTEEAEKRLGELKLAERELLAVNKELQKDYAKNSEAIAFNGLRIKELTREQAALTKVTQNQTTANKAAEGSNDQLRAKLSLLTRQYNALSKEERENTKAGRELTKQTNAISKELKDNEKAIGDNRRNVGDYIKSVNIMGINVGQASEAFKTGAEGIQVFAKGLATSRGAAIALTAVPIILFLTGVIAFFKATDAGADKLAQAVDAVSTGFQVFAKGLAPIGKLLTDLFTDPVATVKKLASGTDEYKVSLDGIATAAYQAAAAQAVLTRELQDLEDAEASLIVSRAKADAAVRLALISTKDRNQTIQARLALLDEAGQKEQQIAQQELENSRQRTLLAQKEAFVKSSLASFLSKDIDANEKALELFNSMGKVTDDLLNAARSANAEFVSLGAASVETLQAIQNRRSVFLQEEQAIQKEHAKKLAEYNNRVYSVEEINQAAAAKASLDRSMAAANKELTAHQDFIKKRIENDKRAVDESVAQSQRESDEKDRIRQYDIEEEQKKYQALATITRAMQSLNSLIAGKNAEATEYGKTLAAIQIATAAAATIAEAIRSARGLEGFSYAAQIAVAVGAATAAIAQVKQIYSEIPETPRPEFYEGGEFGYTGDGPARQESKALGTKPYVYHKRELIASDAALRTPEGSVAGNILMQIMGKQPRFKVPGFYNGGVFDGGLTNRVNSQPVYDHIQMAKQAAGELFKAIKANPPIVQVSNINRAQQERSHVNVTKDLY